jgi:hypothetical protein
MNRFHYASKFVGTIALSMVIFSGCATSSKTPPEVVALRTKLSNLQSDSQLVHSSANSLEFCGFSASNSTRKL